MRAIASWFFTLIPLATGLSLFAIRFGWLRVPRLESKSEAEQRKFRRSTLFGAIICTFAGIGCVLQEAGIMDALARWALTLE